MLEFMFYVVYKLKCCFTGTA